MSSLARGYVAAVLVLIGAQFVSASRVVEWTTADKSFVRVESCRQLADYNAGFSCYGEDGRAIAGADQGDVGHRVPVVRVQQPSRVPGDSNADTYTWSAGQTLKLAGGAPLIMGALMTLAWPAVGALLRRRRSLTA